VHNSFYMGPRRILQKGRTREGTEKKGRKKKKGRRRKERDFPSLYSLFSARRKEGKRGGPEQKKGKKK